MIGRSRVDFWKRTARRIHLDLNFRCTAWQCEQNHTIIIKGNFFYKLLLENKERGESSEIQNWDNVEPDSIINLPSDGFRENKMRHVYL
ncbi:1351_t:CDS:2 [Rhizophagus irregularis]|nr:1351_t:CDS:2 [Rhizophagus irregularis]